MSFIGATGLNTFDDEIENTSNYITRTSFDTSNYIVNTSNLISNHILDTSNYILDTSNILTNYFLNDTSNFIIETSNIVSNHILNTSNYTTRIEGQLSDRIGYPAPLFPLEQPTGVYFPLKTQELLLADAGRVLGAHTIALAGIEEQILGLVGTGGIIGLITGGAVGTALSIANTAKNRADDANDKVDDLIISTTQDKEDTSNFIIDTSNIILQSLEILPYEKLSTPLKDGIEFTLENILTPITSETIIDVDDDYKYIQFVNIETYNIYFLEETEVQILLLDNLKYIETDPFLFSGIVDITVGTPSVFDTITTEINSTDYNSGFLSAIIGQDITYNTPIVIVRYKTKKQVFTQVPNVGGYLNYKLTGWEVSDIAGDTSNFIINTSNIITTRIDNIIPTAENIFPLFYDNHFEYVEGNELILLKNFNLDGLFDYEFLKIPPVIPDIIENVFTPTTSQSVNIQYINEDYNYMAFTHNPNLYNNIARMYPPIRNITSANHTISGQTYGNGLYVIKDNSTRATDQPFNCFNTSQTIGGHWSNTYIQPNGTYNLSNNIVPGYNGDWLKIRFPFAINLTRYAFKIRPNLQSRAPQNFKIYGSNDEINWVELTHGTNPTYVSGLYDTLISTSGTYDSFGLVVNKLVGGDGNAGVLNFDEWLIYGMEVNPITTYDITFYENTECDILIVGGGGAGGYDNAGGGGAGGLVFIDNFTASGTYNIEVGKGGYGEYTTQARGFGGDNSKFNNSTIAYIANGGGGGGGGDSQVRRDGGNGGSGGGSAGEADPDVIGITNQLVYTKVVANVNVPISFGKNGGKGATGGGGGGGGAGEIGATTTTTLGARGGNGIFEANGINFGNIFGLNGNEGYGNVEFSDGNIYFAGGGGGANDNNINSTITNGIFSNRGGFGGGGRGSTNNGGGIGSHGFDGLANTGGGGGGAQYNALPDGRGGNGGSGIVLLRYKSRRIIVSPIQSTGYLNYTNDNGWALSQVEGSPISGGGGTIPLSLSDLTGTMSKNRISDFPVIPATLSDLTGTMLKNRISDFPTIPTTLSNLTGTMLKNRISDFPTIPDAYTKAQYNQILTAYQFSTVILSGLSFSLNKFKYSMNTFGNFDNGFNARMYLSMSARGTSFQLKWCFAAVYFKWNSASGIHFFNSDIINSNNNNEWSIVNGGSTAGNFWINIDVAGATGSNANISQIYLRVS